MTYFFDTSALVKYFHIETGSDKVTEIIESSDNTIWILDIARIEFLCAMYRKYRNNEINDSALDNAINGFLEEFKNFNIEEFGPSIIKEAEYLLSSYGKKYGLRAIDSLHLAALNLISDENWIFAAADNNLCSVAREIGYEIFSLNNYYSS